MLPDQEKTYISVLTNHPTVHSGGLNAVLQVIGLVYLGSKCVLFVYLFQLAEVHTEIPAG